MTPTDTTDPDSVAFSRELEEWLQSDTPKCLGALGDVFEERAFAVGIILLLFVSATPLPTGGVMLTFQIVAAVLAAQLILGRTTPWLPRRMKAWELGPRTVGKAIPFVARRLRWFETHSRPRWSGLYDRRWFNRLLGTALFVLALAAIVSPPLTGLDTLPSLGAVVIAISMIVRDVLVLVLGLLIGCGGIFLLITVIDAAWDMIEGWL